LKTIREHLARQPPYFLPEAAFVKKISEKLPLLLIDSGLTIGSNSTCANLFSGDSATNLQLWGGLMTTPNGAPTADSLVPSLHELLTTDPDQFVVRFPDTYSSRHS
jgi:hypothetical protein